MNKIFQLLTKELEGKALAWAEKKLSSAAGKQFIKGLTNQAVSMISKMGPKEALAFISKGIKDVRILNRFASKATQQEMTTAVTIFDQAVAAKMTKRQLVKKISAIVGGGGLTAGAIAILVKKLLPEVPDNTTEYKELEGKGDSVDTSDDALFISGESTVPSYRDRVLAKYDDARDYLVESCDAYIDHSSISRNTALGSLSNLQIYAECVATYGRLSALLKTLSDRNGDSASALKLAVVRDLASLNTTGIIADASSLSFITLTGDQLTRASRSNSVNDELAQLHKAALDTVKDDAALVMAHVQNFETESKDVDVIITQLFNSVTPAIANALTNLSLIPQADLNEVLAEQVLLDDKIDTQVATLLIIIVKSMISKWNDEGAVIRYILDVLQLNKA